MARTVTRTLCALAMMLAACTGDAGPVARVRFQFFGDAEEIKGYRDLVSAFEQENTDVDVEIVAVPSQSDHMTKLATAFAGGTPPDVFLVNYRRFGQFASKGVLRPVGPLLASSRVIKEGDFFPQAIDAFRFDGKLTCLAQNVSSLVVYYNVSLFKQYGVPEPKAGWTWQEFVGAAKAMTKDTNGDGKTDVYGLSVEPNLIRVAPFVWQNGGEVVDDTQRPTKTVMLGPREIDALRFFIELRRRHKVVPEQKEAESEDEETRFGHGRLGMLLDSRRATPAFRAIEDLDWNVAPLPVGRKAASILHSDAFCLPKKSTKTSASFRFIEFAVGPQGAPILARSGRTVPSLRSVAESDAFVDPSQPPRSAQVFLDAIPLIRRVPNIATWNEIETKANPIIEEWFYGQERIEALGIEIDLATRELFSEAAG